MAVEGIEVLAFPTDGCLGSPAGLLPPDGLGVASSFDAHSRDRSGPSGSFLLRGLGQSRYRITVAHDGEWFPVHGLEADAGTEETLSLVIERAVSVDVTVLGPDARPVVGAEVSAWPLREGGGYSGGWTSSLAFETDQEGVAHMRRLRPGGKYRLSVSPPRDARHLARKHISDWTPRATTVHLRP
jgi:hypothetical protein